MRKQRSEDYNGYREVGIRLTAAPPPGLSKQRAAMAGPLIRAVHEFDKAHLLMLAEQSLIPRPAAALMLATLLEIEQTGMEAARAQAGGGVHSAEHLLIRRHGEEVGGRIALGRSSVDLGALCSRLIQRDALLAMMEALNGLRTAILSLAGQHLESVMPGYVGGRHGQPVTLGHQFAAWAAVFERDFERAVQAYRRINTSPAGAAALTGSDFPIDRHRTAELLGFDRPVRNTLDAVMSRDTVLDSFCVMMILNGDLARLASDILLFCTAEYALADLPDEFCETSSIMSQSRNPSVLRLMAGASAATLGGLATAVMVEKATTGENLVERNYALDALDRLHGETVRDLRLLRVLLPQVRWDLGRMAAQAGRHWAQATDVAGALVREKGLPWRSAHQIVGILVRYCDERGLAPSDVTTELIDEAAVEYMDEPAGLSEQVLAQALDPRHFVEARAAVYGGPAPADVQLQIEELTTALERDTSVHGDAAGHLQAAAAQLREGISELLQSTNSAVQPHA
jgi:argininosuccinate lyase